MEPSACELCTSVPPITSHQVQPFPKSAIPQASALLCKTCLEKINDPKALLSDPKYWHCLQTSMWSENPAIKVLSWRILQALSREAAANRWALDLFDQIYIENDLLEWAKARPFEGASDSENPSAVVTKDSNGAVLLQGDSVTLIKDLEVKGANFTAKRGTLVKGINLTEDPGLVEGRVNGTHIVLKTIFLKKAN
jgi:protein PhnA